MKVIFVSGKAFNGKDTAGEIFKNKLEARGQKVLVTHYADLLKWMCKNYFGWNGEKDAAGRSLLQHVGTDVIRAQIPNFWVDWMIQLLRLFPKEWDFVIIPDARFPNEIEVLENEFQSNSDDIFTGVYHFRVERTNFVSPLTEEQQNHPSEKALDRFGYDRKLMNTTIEDLESQIEKVIVDYFDTDIDFYKCYKNSTEERSDRN